MLADVLRKTSMKVRAEKEAIDDAIAQEGFEILVKTILMPAAKEGKSDVKFRGNINVKVFNMLKDQGFKVEERISQGISNEYITVISW